MASKFVLLCSCKDAVEAEIVKGALKDMGIESILQGENMSQIYGGIGIMSVNILVDEDDYDQARAFMESREPGHDEPEAEPMPKAEPETVQKVLSHSFFYALTLAALITLFRCTRPGFSLEDALEEFILSCNVIFFTYIGLSWIRRTFFTKK